MAFDPRALGAKCSECPFAIDGQPCKPVPAEGPKTPQALLVGEAPSREEAEQGRPLVGMTGRALNQELESVGLQRSQLHVVNAISCQPVGQRNDKDLMHAAECCRPVYLAQTEGLRHLPTFAMGKAAAYAVMGKPLAKGGLAKARGFIRGPEREGNVRAPADRHAGVGLPAWSIISWHPTYALLRDPAHAGEFAIDLERFARLIRGPDHLRLPRKVVTNPDADDIRRLMEDDLPIAVDIETKPAEGQGSHTGKDPTQAQLKTIGLGNIHWGLSFEWSDSSPDPLMLSALLDIFTDPGLLKIFMNGAHFDLTVLRRYGFEVTNWVDIREGRRALSSTSLLRLDYQASIYTDMPPWKEESDVDEDDVADFK